MKQLTILSKNRSPYICKVYSDNKAPYYSFYYRPMIVYITKGEKQYFNSHECQWIKEGQIGILPAYSNYSAQQFFKQNEHLECYVLLLEKNSLKNMVAPYVFKEPISQIHTLKRLIRKEIENYQENQRQTIPNEIQINHLIKELISNHKNQFVYNEEKYHLLAFLGQNFLHHKNLKTLAMEYGLSLSSFNRLFKAQIGKSPYQWIKETRLQYAHKQLQVSQQSIGSIYPQLGFEDFAHFSKSYKHRFGLNPSQANKGIIIEHINDTVLKIEWN
jgi:AraC-like DNA-binding protein